MSNNEIRIEYLTNPKNISDDKTVSVTEMRNHTEIKSVGIEPQGLGRYRKVDKYNYIDTETGEVHQYKQNATREGNIRGVSRTMRQLRQLIEHNFMGTGNEFFVTLTYENDMQDAKQLYGDFDKFMKRLRNRFQDKGAIEYICVPEPQGRGAWSSQVARSERS